jgi:hypothetical protein
MQVKAPAWSREFSQVSRTLKASQRNRRRRLRREIASAWTVDPMANRPGTKAPPLSPTKSTTRPTARGNAEALRAVGAGTAVPYVTCEPAPWETPRRAGAFV